MQANHGLTRAVGFTILRQPTGESVCACQNFYIWGNKLRISKKDIFNACVLTCTDAQDESENKDSAKLRRDGAKMFVTMVAGRARLRACPKLR